MTPKDYAMLAQRAYTNPPQIGVESSSARAIIEVSDDGLAVAFPGTNNLACWLADLDIETIYVIGQGLLHAGFYRSLLDIREQLVEAIHDVPVTLVGHSEGAALAILAGAHLCQIKIPPKAIYAFEPPRVSADSALARLFQSSGVELRLYRNGGDVVPLVPRLTHAWQHCADLTQIGSLDLIPNVEDHMIDKVIAALS
jgi:predicted lipase